MKLIVGLMVMTFAFSALARERSVEDTIALIESDRIVKCDYVKSSFPFCLGISRQFSTCRYKATYVCTGHEDFKVVLKVKTKFNNQTNGRDTVVTEVIY
jgi:hypothetical protein